MQRLYGAIREQSIDPIVSGISDAVCITCLVCRARGRVGCGLASVSDARRVFLRVCVMPRPNGRVNATSLFLLIVSKRFFDGSRSPRSHSGRVEFHASHSTEHAEDFAAAALVSSSFANFSSATQSTSAMDSFHDARAILNSSVSIDPE